MYLSLSTSFSHLYLVLFSSWSISVQYHAAVHCTVYKHAQSPHMMHQASKKASVDDYEDLLAGVAIKIEIWTAHSSCPQRRKTTEEESSCKYSVFGKILNLTIQLHIRSLSKPSPRHPPSPASTGRTTTCLSSLLVFLLSLLSPLAHFPESMSDCWRGPWRGRLSCPWRDSRWSLPAASSCSRWCAPVIMAIQKEYIGGGIQRREF